MNPIQNMVTTFQLFIMGVLVVVILSLGKTIAAADYDTRSGIYMERIMQAADADETVNLIDFYNATLQDVMGHDSSKRLAIKVTVSTLNNSEVLFTDYYSKTHYELTYPLLEIDDTQYEDKYRYAIRDFADLDTAALIEFHFIYDLNK